MVSGDLENNESNELRIGVFVCDCGTNIAGVINVPEVVEFARTLPDVVIAEEGKWICSVDYLSKIKEFITDQDLNRIVVACCTPRTHEPTFKATVKEAGLNPFLLEFVSIREQSSWVHRTRPDLATEKAKDLVRMGVAKARLLEPGVEVRLPVGKECLVIGGGIAGMTSALALGDLGFKVTLVEIAAELGGLMNKLYKIAPADKLAAEIIKPKMDLITNHKNITVHTNTEVMDIKGYVGNFKVRLSKNLIAQKPNNQNPSETDTDELDFEEHKVSTIIVATGMIENEPINQFGYGKYPNVMTQLQFEELLKTNKKKLANLKDIAFINCVNSRDTEHGCCNVGCLSAIKNIKNIKEINNSTDTYLFFRDFNITGYDVQYHYDSMDKYAAAFRYPDNKPPEVEPAKDEAGERLSIQSYDILTGSTVKLNVDLIVLTTGYKGDNSSEQLKGLLKVSTNSDGFFQEAHVKLRPLDFANEGIYVCGCARSPKDIRETLEESIGAAMRAAIPMNRSYVETEGIVANIEPEKCISCGLCMDVCAFGATELVENKSKVIQAICKGCGTCAASCPSEAIRITDYSDDQILAQIDAVLTEHPEDKILAFTCHWCALGAVDNAGMSRFEYPPNIRIIRVMCSGRVDPNFILHAFSCGAAGVLVAGCEFPTCHYISGNHYASYKVQLTKKLLGLVGINPNRLRLEWLSAAQGPRFAKIVTELTNELDKLGQVSNDNFSDLDLQAAIKCVNDYRLKIIGTKITEFSQLGNKYGEIFTDHEVNRLLDEIIYDEYISNRILLSTFETSKSVIDLAKELSTGTPKIFKSIQNLKQKGLIKVDRISDQTIKYRAVAIETANIDIEEIISKPNQVSQVTTSREEKFDLVLVGTSIECLNKALGHGAAGKKVCIITNNASFIPEPALLSENFSDFQSYHNDYSKLVDHVLQHENITILRNSKIHKTQDQDAGIIVEVEKHSNFIDESKCDNCGKCLEVCPVNLIDHDTFGLGIKHAIYHPYPYSNNLKFAISKGLPYCQASCPIMMDVRGYIGNIVDGRLDYSCAVMRRTNPLPNICGKVCDHACESTCARGYLDEPLEIRKLKRFAIEKQYQELEQKDQAIISKPSLIKNRIPQNKIAIIGSGPAGLAAAHDLAYIGYPVTIFEALPEPGGMLRVGIPDYRLPPDALEKELKAILDLGVELKLNTPIGPKLTIDDLKSQGFNAVFIAVGAHKSLNLGIEGEDLTGVINGVQFLREFNLNQSYDVLIKGKNVAVVGGGNVAIDCARTARRLGVNEVHILYRRTKHEMSAEDEELEQCEAEGISVEYLVSPKRVVGEGGDVKHLECQRNELGAPDASGRRRPRPIEGSEFNINVDTVLSAIGQEPEIAFLTGKNDFELTTRSTFIIDERTGATNIKGVFAGGDVVKGPNTVINAIKDGKAAARGIDKYLSGNQINNPNIYHFTGEHRTSELELLRLRKNQLLLSPEPIKKRNPEKLLDSSQRITSFAEVELPITSEDAASEAQRCLSCRMCIGCGVCQAVCPQDAIDFSMPDEILNIQTKELTQYPGLVEGGFNNISKLKELYKNSLNVITPLELEYMLDPKSLYEGKVLRPYDGEIPQNIAFIYLPALEYMGDEQKKLNTPELEHMLKLVKYIKTLQPELNIRLFTNTTDLSELPGGFENLMDDLITIEELNDVVVKLDAEEVKIAENNENTTFELEFNGQKHKFELIVVGAGLRFRNA